MESLEVSKSSNERSSEDQTKQAGAAAAVSEASVAIEIEPETDVDKITAVETSQETAAKNNTENTTHTATTGAATKALPRKPVHPARALSKNGVDLLVDRINSIFLLIVVPVFLIACIVLRINFQSIVYLFLLLLLPFLYPITEKTVSSKLLLPLWAEWSLDPPMDF